jgi:hypothetical protein
VHVDAVRAAVDLQHARLDQVQQLPLDVALAPDPLQAVHGLQSIRVLRDVDSWCHDDHSSAQRSSVVPGVVPHKTSAIMLA